MEIQGLPDYKAQRGDIDKYIDEPLLEYVWMVADKFMPDYDGEYYCASRAPIIFANRYISSRLTDEEKYARYQEIYPGSTLESAKQHYTKQTQFNSSFKEYFLNCKEVLNTLEAFHLDLDKFWYLLLFINDVVEDACTNALTHGLSERDKANELAEGILGATEVITKKDGGQNYETKDEYTISLLKASLKYFIKTYNGILETCQNNEELKRRLKELGMEDEIKDYIPISYKPKAALEKSHKTRLFAKMFQYFLRDKEADREFVKKSMEKISTDKLFFISRLTHIVGFQGIDYYERYTADGNDNRKLSNLLSRYRDEPLPSTIGRIYCGYL